MTSLGHILDNITRMAEEKGFTLSDLAAKMGLTLDEMLKVIADAQKRVDEGLAVGMNPLTALIEAGSRMKQN